MTLSLLSSTPSFNEFDPRIIPYQADVINDILHSYKYSLGTHEILLSGSVGSAKSTLCAWLAIYHCIKYQGARCLLARKSMPDLKDTIFQKVLEIIDGSDVEEHVLNVNQTSAKIKFKNGSEIISRSWADKKYKKVRSLELSMAVFEELTENNDDDKQAYLEAKMRVGRLPHVPNPLIISATNPDSPQHWAYNYFIESDLETRHVYYSVTSDNPFLPKSYIKQLENDLDPKMARRMLFGEWLEITQEVVYYQYSKKKNYKAKTYEPDVRYPILVSWDFNIGLGKPLSAAFMQLIDDHLHIFNEVVVEGMRTEDSCEEMADRGLLDYNAIYRLHGDATGKARSTNSRKSDYDIIKGFFDNYKQASGKDIHYDFMVPKSNPRIRERHNKVNAYCENAVGVNRLTVYKDAPNCDKALRLTQLKKGSSYIEDDSKSYQHVGTAIGYCLYRETKAGNKPKQGTLRL